MALKTATILKGAGGVIGLGSAIVGAMYLSKSPEAPQKQIHKPDPAAPKEEKLPADIAQPKNIKNALEKRGWKPLDTTLNGQTDNKKWEILVKKFNSEEAKQKQRLGALVITTRSWSDDLPANISNMKKACNDLFEKPQEEEVAEVTENEKLAKEWCTAESELLKGEASLSR